MGKCKNSLHDRRYVRLTIIPPQFFASNFSVGQDLVLNLLAARREPRPEWQRPHVLTVIERENIQCDLTPLE